MQLRQLGKSGLMVSELCLGSLTFGGQTSAWDARQMMDQFIHHGGNFFDTANHWNKGQAEEILGQWMTDGKHRQHVIISTKTYLPEDGDANHRRLSRHAIIYSVEQSLRRLQTNYIDLYAPHYWDEQTPLEESLAAFELLIQQGKVRYIAASNYLSWQLAKALGLQQARGWSPLVAVHANYSLIERGLERELLSLSRAENVGILAWSPLVGGFLTGKFRYGTALDENTRLGKEEGILPRFYRNLALNERGWNILETVQDIAESYGVAPALVGLRWVLNRPQVASVIMGLSQIPQVDENLTVLNFQLSPDDMSRLDESSAFELGYPAYMPYYLEELTTN